MMCWGFLIFKKAMMERLIEVGRVNKGHGLKGGAIVYLLNDESTTLREGLEVFLEKEDGEKLETVVTGINYGNKTVVFFKAFPDLTALESFLPFKILVRRSDFPEIEEGEYYISDLMGLKAFDEEGSLVGTVHSNYSNGVQEILTILTPEGLIDIPFVDEFVLEIDLEEKKMVIVRPEYFE